MSIVIEGTDGAGKSTICSFLVDKYNYSLFTHFNSSFGKDIYEIMNKYSLNCLRDRFLYYAMAMHEYGNVLAWQFGDPGKIVFDRYTPISNTVYGHAFNIPDEILNVGKYTNLLKNEIDIVFILTCDFEVASERMNNRHKPKSLYDYMDETMFNRVRLGYEAFDANYSETLLGDSNIYNINTNDLSVEETIESIVDKIKFNKNGVG